jgi:autotransporter-associated beta strand protein
MLKAFQRRFLLYFYAGCLFSCCLAGELGAQTSPIVFNDNASWCWYQDERIIINDNKLIFGSIADANGTGGSTRDGDCEVTTYDLSTSSLSRFTLKDALNSDDHAAPAFMVRPDGKILAVYCKHGGDDYVRYRITTSAGDTSSWSPEQSFNTNSNYGATYSNVYRLSSSGITYDFYRGQDYNPNVLVSSDDGSSWSIGGRLVRTSSSGVRPYAKYASNGADKIWFTYTDGHPRDVVTNIYVAYLQGGNIYNAYGVDIGDLNTTSSSGIAPSAGTKVFSADSTHRAWTSDIQLDSNGYPVLAYSVRIGTVDIYNDHRYRYSRFDGTTWTDYEIAYAGQCLYTAENDYTGLITLNPSDPNTLYISTNADPVTGAALISSADGQRHWEVYRGFTNDNGASWTWTPITANSTTNNIRPILPSWDTQHTALLWLKGTYTSYTAWDMDAVGYIFEGANGIWSNAAGGDWTSGGNWRDGLIADGKLGIADFSTLNVSGTADVQLNGSRTLGFLVFGDTNTSSSGAWAINPGSGGTITLENLGPARPTITVQNQTATINVPLAGTQGLDVKGNGTLILGAENTYSGGTTIYTGSTLEVGDGGALPIAGTVDNNFSLIFNSSGTITLNGAISGPGDLYQNGAGTVILGGNSTYTGSTNINHGALQVTHANALGTVASAVNVAGGDADGRLEIAGASFTKTAYFGGRGASHGANLTPHLVNVEGNNTLTANIFLTEGGYDYLVQSDSGKLTINGSILNNTGNATERYLYLQGEGDGEVLGFIGNFTGTGPLNLIKDGAGTWTLTQNIGYTGDTTVINGILEVVNFNPATANTVKVDVMAGAELVADLIKVNSLTIGSGGKVTIRAIGHAELLTASPVPEPSTIILVIMGLVSLGIFWLRRK